MHTIRESWSHRQWTQMQQSDRREVGYIEKIPWQAKRTQQGRRMVQEAQGLARSILLGDWRSPAIDAIWAGPRGKTWATEELVAAAPCPWCTKAVASHSHVVWECPDRPMRPAPPSDAFTARFGWPGPEEEKQSAVQRLATMVCLAWDATACRYKAKGDEQKAASLRKALNDEGYAALARRPLKSAYGGPQGHPQAKRRRKKAPA